MAKSTTSASEKDLWSDTYLLVRAKNGTVYAISKEHLEMNYRRKDLEKGKHKAAVDAVFAFAEDQKNQAEAAFVETVTKGNQLPPPAP
ncbi:hypothetical protein [Methylovirgula sp. 4M-Z18]|uniref:hypothetical protein n=1 Tax=Methylovirgula sp. 4M-Z18 TaxID=2293567 RepID=UPI0011C02000|nr:hypothetical protein [Methylovirgula sp. 4M-Z18]